jgi:hypothetical protein
MSETPFEPFSAPVVAVTVHRNGALVTRRGATTARALRLDGLPLLFVADSLRVRPARGEVRALRERLGLEASPTPPPEAQRQRIELQLQAQRLDDEDRTLGAQIQLLEKLTPAAPPATARPRLPDAEGWAALAQATRSRLEALDAARAALQVRRRALARERTELDRRATPEATPPRFHRGLTFRLESVGEPDAPVEIEIEYFVEAARWLPAWRLDLSGAEGRLSLEALVAQASGEDWRGARMRFSTADLRRETSVPELRSWRIGPAQPPGRPAFRPLPPGLDALFAGYDRARRGVAPPPPRAMPHGMPVGAPMPAPPPPPPREHPADDDSEASIEFSRLEDTGAAPPPPAPMRAPQAKSMPERARRSAAAPGNMPAPAAALAMSMPEGAVGGFGGGGPPTPAPEPLPPRLRHPWLRLAGADEPNRGTLQPMDPFTQLWALVESQGVAAPDQLRRALEALTEAAWRLRSGPPPAGTRPLPETHFQSIFSSPSSHDVPGDGQFHRLRVSEEDAAARAEWRCVPRESPDVWRFCVLAVRHEVPRPAGPLSVYRDGEFLVTSALDPGHAGPEGALALNLGLEPDLRITHRGVHIHQEDKGLVGASTRVDHRVTVQVRSTLPGTAPLVIHDRLPVPADERQEKDLEVQLLESRPSPTRTERGPHGESLAGGLQWAVEVAPGEHVAVEFTYRVTLPARFELDGGNRREN